MEKSIITFSANEQNLQKTGGIGCYASDTVSYIEAQFALGENWSGYDSIRAVWFNDYKTISTVLDPGGVCIVPHEVLVNRGKVMVNLVGSVLVSDELKDRLTTFPCEALKVSAKAKISGSETAAVTPSQFEQFVSVVISEVEKVTGMTAQAETLPAGSQATARYEDGILYLGIPQGIRGERGERGEAGADGADGNGIASVVYNSDYSLTLIFDNGERFTTPPIRGERGPAGQDGRDGTDGTDGVDGVTPNLSIGNVTTLEPSEDAYVTRRGTDENPIFDFGIPKGDKGDDGTVPDLDLILPTDTASGDIASITDGQNVVPVKSLKVTLEPIQSGSGTPSPDNVRPISGHTECVTSVSGVNVWDEEWESGGLSSGTGQNSANPGKIRSKNYVHVLGGASYYFRVGSSGGLNICQYDANKNYLGIDTFTEAYRSQAVTLNSNCAYIRFSTFGSSTTTYNHDISINYPSTDHDYHTYDGTTYTTDLGRTVYGADVEQVGGVLTDKMAIVDLGTLSWRASSQANCFYAYMVTPRYKLSTTTEMISDIYEFDGYVSGSPYYGANGTFRYHFTSETQINYEIYIKDERFSTLAELVDGISGHYFCYELAEPQTYQLDPQTISLLKGNNNVWSDGEVELTYNADVQLWVLKQLGTSGTRTLSMTKNTKSEETKTDDVKTDAELTKSDNIQLAED